MYGNAAVQRRLGTTHRMADAIISMFAGLRQEADAHWERLSVEVSSIGKIVMQKDYTQQLPEDWREQVMAFSKIRVQRGFAYLGDLVTRTELHALGNYHEWRAQVKLMHEAIEQERAFTRMCENWLESQKEWRRSNG